MSPGAVVVLKSLAVLGRGEYKDAYELYYVLQHYGAACEEPADRLQPLLDNPHAQQALACLAEDFTEPERLGPSRVAVFLQRAGDGSSVPTWRPGPGRWRSSVAGSKGGIGTVGEVTGVPRDARASQTD